VIDGLVSVGIYVLFAIPVDLAFTAYRIGGWTSLSRQLGLPETLGLISAQFTLLVILVSVLAFLRSRVGTVRFVLLDWKWWVIALVVCALPTKPILNWVGASLIYQYRQRRRRMAQDPTAPA
jgi:small-conductance mechanosensitive channel